MTGLRKIVARTIGVLGSNGRRVMHLIGGATAAQFIPVAAAPILTRLYSPADYGTVAVFGSALAVLTAVMAGRYSVAIMLPTDERDAVQVAGLAISIAVTISALSLLVVSGVFFLFPDEQYVRQYGGLLFLLPLGAMFGSVFESLSYYALRADRTGEIGRANVLKASMGTGAQIGLGLVGSGVAGLLTGVMLGLLSGNTALLMCYVKGVQKYRLSSSRMWYAAMHYSKFPKFDLWANLANVLSYNVTVFGVGLLYGVAALGQYALASRLTALPSALIGVALGQVYLRAASHHVNSKRAAVSAFNRTVHVLTVVSIVPMIVLAFWGPDLFGVFLGPEWRLAGVYASAMVPLVWARFIASPLSPVFYIYGHQGELLVFQLLLLASTVVTMTIAGHLAWSLQTLVLAQSGLLGTLYLILLWRSRAIVQHTQVL